MKSREHGHVNGLGSARHGTGHWWQMRVSAIALVILCAYVVGTFVWRVIPGGYDGAIGWLSSPFDVTFVILFIAAAFYHAALGLQVVIEDYVHTEGLKLFSILAIKFIAATLAVLGILSTVKILFWTLASG